MQKAGHTQDEICDLFALHASSGDCFDLVDLSEVFDGPLMRPPTGLGVLHLRPESRGDASGAEIWFLDSVGSAEGYRVRAEINGSLYEQIEGEAEAIHRVPFEDLPFDKRIDFEVRFTHGAEQSGAESISIVTEAEPVEDLSESSVWAYLSWDETEASTYRVYVRDENDVVHQSDSITGTSYNVTNLVPVGSAYTAWVVSLNQEGEECSFASDEYSDVALELGGPG